MVSSIFFVITFLLLLSSLVLCFKVKQELNLIREIVMNLLFILCYATMGSGILSVLNLPVNLNTVGIMYLIPACILWGYIIKTKKIQQLVISRIEVISVVILTVVFIAVELKTFSFEMRAAYNYNTDAGNHLNMALSIVRSQKVSGMHFASLFNALCIEIFQPMLEEIRYYKGFVFADSLHYYIEMIFAYAVIFSVAQKKHTKYLAPVITLLLWAGYPLYSYIEGHYVYWGWGAVVLCFMIHELEQASEEKNHYVFSMIRAIAGFIGVTFSYSLFAPLALVIAGVWAVTEYKRKEIHLSRKIYIGIAAVGVVCIAFIGYVYYSYFYLNHLDPFASLKVHGGGFGPHLFTDFVWTLPVMILFFAACFKKEIRFHVYGMAFLTSCIVQICLLAAFFAGQISDYYYYKFYYPLWFLNWIVVALAIDTVPVERKERKYIYAYAITVGIIYISTFGKIPEKINSTSAGWLTNEGSMGTYLYTRNMGTLGEDFENKKYSTAQFEICEYVMENLRSRGESVPFAYWWDCGGPNNWYRAITDMPNSVEYGLQQNGKEAWREVLESGDFHYYVVLKESELYRDNRDYFDAQTWIFENEDGFIVQKNQN